MTSNNQQRPHLMLVHEQSTYRQQLQRTLTERGFDVSVTHTISEAFTGISEDPPGYLVIDLETPRLSKLALIEQLKAINPRARIVGLASQNASDTVASVVKAGTVHHLAGHANIEEIVGALRPLETAAMPTSL